jgi:hypothetical protein
MTISIQRHRSGRALESFDDDSTMGSTVKRGVIETTNARRTVIRLSRFYSCLIAIVGLSGFVQACGQKNNPKPEKAAVSQTKPQIAVNQKEFNFGKIKQGQSVDHVFEIVNRGNAELILHNAVSSCGCLTAVLSSKTIAPGEKGQVKATLSTASIRGKQIKQIYINSNDPNQARVAIKVEGEVIADLAIDPALIWLKEVRLGEKVTRQFTVTVSDAEKVKVADVTADDQRFVIRRISSESKGNAVYEVQFLGSEKVETISAQLSASTEDRSIAPVRAPIRLRVVGDLRYPKTIQLIRKPDGTASADLTITSRSNKAFDLKRVEDPHQLLKLEILESKGPSARIRVQLAADAQVPARGKLLTFTAFTNDSNEPKLEIGVFIYQKSAATPKGHSSETQG